jgi:hypothetical protein
MARRTFYRGDKRRKEEVRKAKQEAKRQERAARGEGGEKDDDILEAPEADLNPPGYVWFSASRNRTLTTERPDQPDLGPPNDWLLLTPPPKTEG